MGGGYCRLQMPLGLAQAVRDTVARHRRGALQGGGGGYLPPFRCIPAPHPPISIGAGGWANSGSRFCFAVAFERHRLRVIRMSGRGVRSVASGLVIVDKFCSHGVCFHLCSRSLWAMHTCRPAATRRNVRRAERVTVQGPVKKQEPDGMSHGGGGGPFVFALNPRPLIPFLDPPPPTPRDALRPMGNAAQRAKLGARLHRRRLVALLPGVRIPFASGPRPTSLVVGRHWQCPPPKKLLPPPEF